MKCTYIENNNDNESSERCDLKNHYQQQLNYIVENNERFLERQYRYWFIILTVCCVVILVLLFVVAQRNTDMHELKEQLKEQTEIAQTCTMSIDNK